ncbi:MAG: hypothetical protein Q8K32_26175 [Archangium sp.]|nr:hypothetical protein [Archangium sp.]
MRTLSPLWALGLLASLSACPPNNPKVPDAAVEVPVEEVDAGPTWAGTCVRLETALLTRTRCTRDENCGCGTGCDRGLCTGSCAFNTECAAGSVCDSFGRCVSTARANLPNPVSGLPRGTLVVDRQDVDLFNATNIETLKVSAKTLDLVRVRLAAEAGLEVACSETAAFASECTFATLVATANPSVVRVRSTGSFPSTTVRKALDVFAEGQHLVVGVALRGEVAGPAVPRFGTYRGSAQLVGAGLRARTTLDTLPPELTRLELPVSAEIHPPVNGVYTVRLTDKRQTVFPQGATATLGLRTGSNEWQLQMPSTQYLGADVPNVTGAQLDVHAAATMDDATFREGLLDGDFIVTFEGIAPVASAPFLRWRLTLVRSGDLPAGSTPPAVTPRAVAPPGPRASALFDDETTARAVLGDYSALTGLQRVTASVCSVGPTQETSFVTTLASLYGPGELSCNIGGAPRPQKAFGLDTGFLQNRGEYLTNCVSALDLSGAPALSDASTPGACVNRTRAVTALGYATETDRLRAFGGGQPLDPQLSRQHLHLFQQWMSVMSVVAMEPRRLNALAPLLPAGSTTDKLRQYSDPQLVFTSLQRSVNGWDLLLHPRFGAALMATPGDALGVPDYRQAFGSTSSFPLGEQGVGLPVTMLFTLSQQLNGMQGLIDDLLYARAPSDQVQPVTAALAGFLPRSVVIFAAAQGLRDAARSVGTPTWELQWKAARSAWGTSTTRLLQQLDFFEQGKNPLGIEDGDLPLYRLGDQEGTTRRFSAVSDSLLGREDLLDPAIAPTLIEQATQSELLARASITSILQRDLVTQQENAASSRRVEDLKRFYGDQISSLCGDYNSFTVLDMVPAPNADTCYFAPGCRSEGVDYSDRLNIADVGYQICMAQNLRQRFGVAITTGDAALDVQLDALPRVPYDATKPFFSEAFAGSLVAGFEQGYNGVKVPEIRIPTGIDPAAVAAVESLCGSMRTATLGARPTITPTSCQRTDECPNGLICRSAVRTCVPDDAIPDPACYRGSLGDAALAVTVAASEVDIARAELEEFSERYDGAMRGCFILQQGNAAIEAAITQHNGTMSSLANAKFAADQTAKIAQKARDLFNLENVWQWVGSLIFGAIGQAAESTADTLALRMDEAGRQHELTITKLEGQTALRQCISEAEIELVGARSASLTIRRQVLALSQTLVQFNNLKASLQGALDDGHSSIEAEAYRKVAVAQVDFWLDSNLDLHTQRMRRARRALYLAILATEYEFQFSSSERSKALSAKTTTELEDSLRRVRDFVRRGAPAGGGNPTQLITVLSLKNNLLQLANRQTASPGAQQLDETQRLQRLLTSPQYAVYGSDGRYQGQEIPFSLQPLASLGLGDTGAVPLLSGLNCAERVWSINASVLGQGLMVGTNSSIVTLQLRKRNTFASQLCTGGGELQSASTRPSQNLFVDPFSANTWANDSVLAGLTDTRETSAYSFATVQARTNVPQRELERLEYQDGQSTALAGRGVFGDYTLFIPATTQSLAGSAGLQLDKVEDVLIRLDYVAAELR